jgi:nucleosome binding factor SPN SPT16 subunit
MVEEIINCRPELHRIRPEEFFKIISDTKANPRQAENHREFIAEMVNSLKVPNNPARVYAGFMNSQGKPSPNQKKNPDILTMADIRKRGCIVC